MNAALRIAEPADRGVTPAAPGRRFYDAATSSWMVKIFPGDYYATANRDEILVTVLGSCVSACIRDPRAGFGGMNHFMLADGDASSWGGQSRAARFGSFAMEKLINELIKAGCSRESLEIKVFGGGNVTDSRNAVGTDNAEFVLRYLKTEGLGCAAKDLGGSLARRIHYYPSSGKVVRRFVNSAAPGLREENDYTNAPPATPAAGVVELFGQ